MTHQASISKNQFDNFVYPDSMNGFNEDRLFNFFDEISQSNIKMYTNFNNNSNNYGLTHPEPFPLEYTNNNFSKSPIKPEKYLYLKDMKDESSLKMENMPESKIMVYFI